jgi:hypothetical protein
VVQQAHNSLVQIYINGGYNTISLEKELVRFGTIRQKIEQSIWAGFIYFGYAIAFIIYFIPPGFQQ